MLQGASNLWFPVLISALSVPQATDDLGRLIEENWAVLDKAVSLEVLKAFRMIGQLKDLTKYNDGQIWTAIQKTIQGVAEEVVDPDDLKSPEWKVFSNPTQAKELTDKSRNPLVTLAKSTELWERRIAIIATQHFIRRGEFRDTLKISQTLLSDTEDLIHKATGWMLREVGKRHEPTLTTFLEQHGTVMPRTMLRYAMERLSPKQRQEFLLRK